MSKMFLIKLKHRKEEVEAGAGRNMETLFKYAGRELESQSPPGVEYGEGCEGQQEELLQVHQPQKEDQGNLNEVGELLTRDLENSKVVNAFLASIFAGSTGLQKSQTPEIRRRVRSSGDLSLVEENHTRKHLNWTYI